MNLLNSGLFLLQLAFLTHGYVKLTNLKCIEFDKTFATIPICKLRIVQRGTVAANVYVKLHQIPVNNVTVNFELLKKANGYKPFLYNVSADFCKYMKTYKKFSFIQIVVDILVKHSNINHTCPYDHDIIIENLILKDDMFKILPLPFGDYLLNLRVAAYNDWKACVTT